MKINYIFHKVDTKEIERIVREHFYPGPVSGSTERLTKALQEYLEELIEN